MGNRLSKIVTRTGDDGTTGLADGSRLAKDDIRVHCLGDIDELNAAIGLLISQMESDNSTDRLLRIQHELFDLGAELSQPDKQLLNPDYIAELEKDLEQMNTNLPPLQEFILPGGSIVTSQVHVARTICRRLERTMSALHRNSALNPASLSYINRLSDFLFVLARYLAKKYGQQETYWQSKFSRVPPSS